ncbi:alpha/beta hydrolase [Salinilacihabitans rarus]|uniref:alpha/beta hydrolase n=1 Tax=Salinilacihabitans rarus TaxID=2961596 RepID=UPI0020C84B5E|nr:alpha/beta hydrolase [Salinilacihabitans rarus]
MVRHTTSTGTDSEPTASRRRLLRGLAASGLVGGAALAGASTASAGKKEDCENPPTSFPRVTTRGHFDTTWYGSVYITDGNDATNYGYAGDGVPGVHVAAGDELLVFVHGWNNDTEGALCTFDEAAGTFAAEGYAEPVIGYSWDADFDWYDATEIAERNGAKLAAFTRDYKAANPGVAVRYVAHSLGARVALMALQNLAHWGRYDDVASLSLLGGAADDESVSMEGSYGGDIEAAVGHADNFWMEDDDVLNWAYGTAEWGEAVGNAGCDGTPPSNYTDHNVAYVPSHGDYYREDGCIHEVVATF